MIKSLQGVNVMAIEEKDKYEGFSKETGILCMS
jgi:hypothetical protein